MTIVRLFSGERDPLVVNAAHIRPYEARSSSGRHPVVKMNPGGCDFKYLLEAVYRGNPLIVRGSEAGNGGELVNVHGIKRIQFLPDAMSELSPALKEVEPNMTLVRLIYFPGEEPMDLALEHIRSYDVNGLGSARPTISLKRTNGCDNGYLLGALHCGEPLALLYSEGQEEHGDIISLRGVKRIKVIPPA